MKKFLALCLGVWLCVTLISCTTGATKKRQAPITLTKENIDKYLSIEASFGALDIMYIDIVECYSFDSELIVDVKPRASGEFFNLTIKAQVYRLPSLFHLDATHPDYATSEYNGIKFDTNIRVPIDGIKRVSYGIGYLCREHVYNLEYVNRAKESLNQKPQFYILSVEGTFQPE